MYVHITKILWKYGFVQFYQLSGVRYDFRVIVNRNRIHTNVTHIIAISIHCFFTALELHCDVATYGMYIWIHIHIYIQIYFFVYFQYKYKTGEYKITLTGFIYTNIFINTHVYLCLLHIYNCLYSKFKLISAKDLTKNLTSSIPLFPK